VAKKKNPPRHAPAAERSRGLDGWIFLDISCAVWQFSNQIPSPTNKGGVMMTVNCPWCKKPLDVEENDPDSEWECPTCGASFVLKGSTGNWQASMTQPAKRTAIAPGTPGPTAAPQPAINDEAYAYALECLLKGSKPRDVRRRLLDAGYTGSQADRILNTAMQYQKNSEARERMTPGSGGNTGQRNMLIGGIICVIGIVVTLGTMAASAGGGSYVVAWGAIVFGGLQFVRGWMQTNHPS
jgi:hypothetical protein